MLPYFIGPWSETITMDSTTGSMTCHVHGVHRVYSYLMSTALIFFDKTQPRFLGSLQPRFLGSLQPLFLGSSYIRPLAVRKCFKAAFLHCLKPIIGSELLLQLGQIVRVVKPQVRTALAQQLPGKFNIFINKFSFFLKTEYFLLLNNYLSLPFPA